MASTAAVSAQLQAPTADHRGASAIPWYLKSLTLAVCLVVSGGQIDVSWHRSIGRDTFWTPPHMMVYACGLIAGITCGWLILATTFGNRPDLRAASVNLFGLRAPLGVLLTAWGGMMMLYSAPVDNWWHNAYGLDVRVASPPHMLLLAGTSAVILGTLLLAAAHMNRNRLADPANANPAHARLFLFLGALAVTTLMSYSMGYTFDTRLHQAKAYIVIAMSVPFAFAALCTAAAERRTATRLAAIYTAIMLIFVWGLPLIPASPRIGPVWQHITCMIPPKFPILLLASALIFDLLWRSPVRSQWMRALLVGVSWLGVLLAVEWPFATFLMSPLAANRFFATRFLDFGTPSNNPDALRVFEQPQHGLHLAVGLIAAAVVATVGVRCGELFGRWMRQIYR